MRVMRIMGIMAAGLLLAGAGRADYYPSVATKGTVSDGEVVVFSGADGKYIRSSQSTNAGSYMSNLVASIGTLTTNLMNATNNIVGTATTNKTLQAATNLGFQALHNAQVNTNAGFQTLFGYQAATNLAFQTLFGYQAASNLAYQALFTAQAATNLAFQALHNAQVNTNAGFQTLFGYQAATNLAFQTLFGYQAASNLAYQALFTAQAATNLAFQALHNAQVNTNAGFEGKFTVQAATNLAFEPRIVLGETAYGWSNHATMGYLSSQTNIMTSLFVGDRTKLAASVSGLTTGLYAGALTSVAYTGVTELVVGRMYAWGYTKIGASGTSTLAIAGQSLLATAAGNATNHFTYSGTDTNLVLTLDGTGMAICNVSNVYVRQITNGVASIADDLNVGGDIYIGESNSVYFPDRSFNSQSVLNWDTAFTNAAAATNYIGTNTLQAQVTSNLEAQANTNLGFEGRLDALDIATNALNTATNALNTATNALQEQVTANLTNQAATNLYFETAKTNFEERIATHTNNMSNPHSVTLAQVGGTLNHGGLTNQNGDTNYLHLSQTVIETGPWMTNANDVAIGNTAKGSDLGVAIGSYPNATNHGISIGNLSRGEDYGVGVGNSAMGYNYSVAIGASSHAYNYSVAIGYQVENNTPDTTRIRGDLDMAQRDVTNARAIYAGSGAFTNSLTLGGNTVLTNELETLFTQSVANLILLTDVEAWDQATTYTNEAHTAYGWGDWSTRMGVVEGYTNEAHTAYGWGDWSTRMGGVEGYTNAAYSYTGTVNGVSIAAGAADGATTNGGEIQLTWNTNGLVKGATIADGAATSVTTNDGVLAITVTTNAQVTADAALPKAGGTMSGILDMGGQVITNSGAIWLPTNGIIYFGVTNAFIQCLGTNFLFHCGTNEAIFGVPW